MHLERVDLNLLVVFDAVASAGSVTRAAKQLSLSQPAVSHALNRLRDLMGDPLFVRSRGGLAPTPRGESMVAPVRDILAAIGSVLTAPGFDPSSTTKRFCIGASDYSMMTVVPELVRRLRARAPAARLEIRAMGRDSLEELESGDLDLAFWGATPPGPPFESQQLFFERFVGLLCERHPMAIKAAQGALTLEEYLGYPHVLVTFRDPRQSPIDARLAEIGRSRTVAVVTPSFASNVASLRGTDLIMSLPSRLAANSDKHGLLQFELPLAVSEYPYSFVWHRRTNEDPAIDWLRTMTASCAA